MKRSDLLNQRLATIEEEIDRLDSIADLATNSDRPNLAAAATAASRWATLRDKRYRILVELEAINEPDPIEVIRMYRDASFIDGAAALSGLLEMETEMLRERRRQEEEASKSRATGVTNDTLYDVVAGMLDRMPPAQRQALRARLDGTAPAAN